ncbi:uncharacterized protein LOC131166239 [Malania oleifera]|uniref:uncharacterized protein LOC131166239 n=1 Tax=Malania oleifera TaxID=397392 RepID=UPI0025AE0E1B|nr:uncharacterized protein LOC131166239 [Malania oleifera]XP_057980571.1 uncharacterized protein LOC131166239 [Malania oleifera]XP_057980572.1 uncharacterized protein LOC131166239 [Malania oleifera]XP_057980574.1 uncharacterized protein LOC131166239 [Malania oleifera]XP_057980575.1 uncharacterized protein LOC131166239 [Malania oleifera]
MQRGREGRDDLFRSGDHFDDFVGFGGFGSRRSLLSSMFGGRDPFNDPFFTCPFGSLFGSSMMNPSAPSGNTPQIDASKGLLIEEISSDDDKEEENEEVEVPGAKQDKPQKYLESSIEPLVEHPDDYADDRNMKRIHYRNDHNQAERTQPQAQSFSFRKVTYGGLDGAYYTSCTTRKTGSNGLVVEESREADRTSGQAAHRISRGIHDKGHSVMKKLNSDGRVDTVQTLHNLNEDELAGFDEAWKSNSPENLSGWKDGFGMHRDEGASSSRQGVRVTSEGWALPSIEHPGGAGGLRPDNELKTNEHSEIAGGLIHDGEPMTNSSRKAKKVVRINIE